MVLINIIGNYEGNNTGYGTHIRNYWNSLKKLQGGNYIFHFTDYLKRDELIKGIEISKKFPSGCINILISGGNSYNLLQNFGGVKIIFTVFESTKLPIDWIESLNKCDYIFTASKWGKYVMVMNGINKNKIFVVPEGVNPLIYNPWGNKIKELNTPTFKFLVVGKFEERKSYREILEAFSNTFSNNENVELFLKANSFVDAKANMELEELIKKYNMNNVKLIGGNITEDVLAGIYRSCDCFVFPSKAEGWGLPLIEALACGIPVITTFYSGHTEFLECCKDYIADVNFHLEEIKAEDFLRWGYKFNGDPGKWAIPNIDTISNKMKHVYENKDEWKLKGLNASEKIHNHFNWDNSAYRTMSVINSLPSLSYLPNI
jgi:glycosyltransferase involved in cell wall biosynthesis